MSLDPVEIEIPDLEVREGASISDSADNAADDTAEEDPFEVEDTAPIDDDDGGGAATLHEAVTRSGRTTRPPSRLIEEVGAVVADYEAGLTVSEFRFYATMKEFPAEHSAPGEVACVGAGLGGGFENTR